MSQTYTFFDFILKPEESSLFHKKERLDLGLKGLNLLVTFVVNQGKVLSKDELIIAGWDKQIVTDGTLSKQIERIRQILGTFYPDEKFIQTIHGIGYQFTPKIKSLKDKKKGLNTWQKAIASVSLIPLLLFLYFYPFNQEQKNSQNGQNQHQTPFNIAVIPMAQGDNYMNQGGINYLSILLGRNPRIYHTSPRSEWFKTEDKQKLAIELEDQKKLDYVLLVDIKEEGVNKIARLELKNNQQFKQQTQIQALTFKQLFADLNAWVLIQLKINNDSKTRQSTENLSDDSYAVESFLRGKKQASNRSYEKAIQFFKIAITQDPDFDLAILNLAHSQIKSNDYVSAQAIIDTLHSSKVLNDDLKLYALILQSSLYIRTAKATKAKPVLEEAFALAEKLNDAHSLILAYYYQSEMYTHLGQIQLSIVSTLKQKQILEQNSNDKSGLMRIANNLAYSYFNLNQFELAKQQIEPAIEWFEQTNHTVGKINSYSLQASILFEMAEFKQEQNVIEKALQLTDQVENDYLQVNVLETNGYLQLELGHHKKTKSIIKELEALGVRMDVTGPKFSALILKLELANRTKNISQIQSTYPILDNLTLEQIDDIAGIRHLSLILLAQSNFILNKLDLAKKQIYEAKQMDKHGNMAYILLNNINNYQWMYKNGSHQQASKKLQQLLTKMIQTKQNKTALTVAYLLLDNNEKNGFNQSYAILQKIEHLDPLPYPYLKHKAKLAAHNSNYFEASKLMQQMKNTSNEWWDIEDQLLLDSYSEKIKIKMKVKNNEII